MLSKLILIPSDVHAQVHAPDLLDGLSKIGLIGKAFQLQDSMHYQVGEQFLEQVIFLGCSPYIALQASEVVSGENVDKGEGYCHVCIRQTDELHWMLSSDAVEARCCRCRASTPFHLPEITLDLPSVCPACKQALGWNDWDLRKKGGIGRTFIEIWGIHPHEAVPAESLLAGLANCSKVNWRYFYSYGKEFVGRIIDERKG